MKNVQKFLYPFIGIAVLFYLFGAVFLSFNPREWNDNAKIVYCLLMAIVAFFVFIENAKNKNE